MAIESTKSKCPGQDTMFWKPEDIFDVECSKCGLFIEFFKDEVSRKCKCGNRVMNPQLNLGCAKWCEHAKECLGYDPKERQEELEKEVSGNALSEELTAAMKKEFGDDSKRIQHALWVLGHAESIMRREGGDPKVVLAAAVLHDIGIKKAEEVHGSSAGKYQEIEGPAIAERIMKEIGMDYSTIADVKEIVANHHSAGCKETTEFKIIWDADWLVNFADEFPNISGEEAEEKINKLFRTETGRKKALELFSNKKKNEEE